MIWLNKWGPRFKREPPERLFYLFNHYYPLQAREEAVDEKNGHADTERLQPCRQTRIGLHEQESIHGRRSYPGWSMFGFIICGSCHKYHFCRGKTFIATNTCFVATKVCLSRQIQTYFCRTKLLSRQNYFCCDKLTQTRVNRDKTRLLSRRKYACRDKRRVLSRLTRVCRNKNDTCGSSCQ